MQWIVVSNSNLCRIFSFNRHSKEMTVIKEIAHPENKLKTSNAFTDKPGHYSADGTAGGSYMPHSDPKEVIYNDFSREVAHALNQGRTSNAYENIILITSPHMDGLLLKHLDKHVKEMILKEINKDVVQLPIHELKKFIVENI